MVPAVPQIPYDPRRAEAVLACAETWLARADRLVYSYGSRTFLSGYDLYDADRDGRGNIDCSTFVLLVLAGVSYEESPYALGSVRAFLDRSFGETAGGPAGTLPSIDPVLADFRDLPDRFVDIAERIGRPYLRGPKGLDLAKAEEMGIDLDTLGREIRAAGGKRRSAQIAQYYGERGACFTDPVCAMPGDLVFYRSVGYFTEGERVFPASAEVNHVGIIARDPSRMINSTGLGADDAGVSLMPVFGKRGPAFFARTGPEIV